MRKHLKKLSLIGSALCVIGCATSRTVVIDATRDIVRLGPDVRGHVYVYRAGQWQLTGDKVTLPEGWYAGAAALPAK